MNTGHLLYTFFDYGILIFAIFIALSYLLLGILSMRAIRRYIQKNAFVNYRSILSSPLAPSVSLIAPAYNEDLNIVENIRSLLSIHYSKYEVIVVNDGSTDQSLQKMITAYNLEKVNFAVDYRLACNEVKAVYKSKSKEYSNLSVVDKINGGKADALNAGINIASAKYIACIDVDCVIEADALLRMVKPFMEQGSRKVIATGGVIRIANSCQIETGRLIKVNIPEMLIPRFQVLEYIRAFLLGRMAWGRLNGLLIISGAFGMFDREVVIEAGGYDHNTVGEDMELVVRMRRYMTELNEPYEIAYIPDPLCWTEAPTTIKILYRQRNRWTRGNIETLRKHKIIAFNRRYGLLGTLSYPYWLVAEWLAPIIEFSGIVFFFFLVYFGMANMQHFYLLLTAVYSFAIMLSLLAIWLDQLTYNQYSKSKDLWKLILTALLEPIVFHPIVLWATIRGNIDYLRGKKAWGGMARTGFQKKES